MKIYVTQNNQRLGPYSQEEVRNLIYSGDVQRSSLACREGATDWVPLDTLLTPQGAVSAAAPPPVAIPLDRLRDSKEKTALLWLYIASIPAWLVLAIWIVASFGVLLVVIGFITLLVLVGELWFGAYLKTNAVRLSETQLPDLFGVVQASCQRLEMVRPDVYVMQQNVWNAFATKIWGRRMVVLLSGAVDSILLKGDMEQMAWLVGHELGHHHAGHLDFSRKLANVGGWCVWLKLWYSRRCELTCDRIGLYSAGSLKASQLALMNATVGAQLAGHVNMNEAAVQWHTHRREFFVQYRTLYSTHPHHLARLDNLATSAAELGITR